MPDPSAGPRSARLEGVGFWVVFLGAVTLLGPGAWRAIHKEMTANEAVYDAGCCGYPVALKSIEYGFGQGIGLGFGVTIWSRVERLTSNDPPAKLEATLRYDAGGASKEHPYAWGLGVVFGWVTAMFAVLICVMLIVENRSAAREKARPAK